MKYTLLKNKVTGARSILVCPTPSQEPLIISESDKPAEYARLRKLAIKNGNVRERDAVLRSCGLVKTPYGWE